MKVEVGDKFVSQVWGVLQGPYTVKRILKRFIEFENGRRMDHSGIAYPRHKNRIPAIYRKATQSDLDQIEESEILDKIDKISVGSLPLDKLRRIVEIIEEEDD